MGEPITIFDLFHRNLRFLLVEADVKFRNKVKEILQSCSYEVTDVGLASAAITLLKRKRDLFDCVIADIAMPDMDAITFLKVALSIVDIPVVLKSKSTDNEVSIAKRAIRNGACHFLTSSENPKDFMDLWQYVYKRKKEPQGFQSENSGDSEKEIITPKKKKKPAPRLTWTTQMHQMFLNALQTLGREAMPRKILELMNVPGLETKHVASHLQKYRLRLQREVAEPGPEEITNEIPILNRFYVNTVNQQMHNGPVDRNINSGEINASMGQVLQPNLSQLPLQGLHVSNPFSNENVNSGDINASQGQEERNTFEPNSSLSPGIHADDLFLDQLLSYEDIDTSGHQFNDSWEDN